MTIRCLIADDESNLRTHLRSQLALIWPELVVCAEAENGRQALDLVREHNPEIVFLDIKMPGMSGMEVAGRIAGQSRIVFVTAYDAYAVEAFEKAAADYLLKPVTRARLEKTVLRLQSELESEAGSMKALPLTIQHQLERLNQSESPAYLQWIKASHGRGVQLVSVDEVCYFQASHKYTLVVTRTAEYLVKKTITSLARELDPGTFWQIHRKTIVNITCVQRFQRNLTGGGTVKLKDRPEPLEVSRAFSHRFRQM
ncbi:MAG: LytTR family DNA-binding domain-containing protein [Desulfohalobiaceae bacterium]|nr:LytTR family DNA-binding domain-containing protein [Desulfohalobiaceae bacterium]